MRSYSEYMHMGMCVFVDFMDGRPLRVIVSRSSSLNKGSDEIRCSLNELRESTSWEQRKLGECFTERKEKMPDGDLLSVTISDGVRRFFELGRHDNSNEDKTKYKKVCKGDIAYNSMRMWQGACGYSGYEGIVSPAYTVLSPFADIVNSKCMSYFFKRNDMMHVFQIHSQGITSDNWNLKYPALSEIKVMISLDVYEQQKIAECLSKFDHLITLHQRWWKWLHWVWCR